MNYTSTKLLTKQNKKRIREAFSPGEHYDTLGTVLSADRDGKNRDGPSEVVDQHFSNAAAKETHLRSFYLNRLP